MSFPVTGSTEAMFPINAASMEGGFEMLSSPCDDGYRNDLTIDNCLIFGNTAGMRGGGAFFGDSTRPTVSNTTITDNYCFEYGGAVHAWTSCTTIVNSILWSNASYPAEGRDLSYSNHAELRVLYSDVEVRVQHPAVR